MLVLAIIAGVLLSPLWALLAAGVRALVLFWPTMLALGALNTYVDWVPALSWQGSFFAVLVAALLIPTQTSAKKE